MILTVHEEAKHSVAPKPRDCCEIYMHPEPILGFV